MDELERECVHKTRTNITKLHPEGKAERQPARIKNAGCYFSLDTNLKNSADEAEGNNRRTRGALRSSVHLQASTEILLS